MRTESKEEQYKRLYESAAAICGIYNGQLFNAFQKIEKLELENKSPVREEADSECYAVAKDPNQRISAVVAKMKCLSCGELGLNPFSNYCPNCGRKFK